MPGASVHTARSAPARSKFARMRFPLRRPAAAPGINTATAPPGFTCARQCCTHASSDSPRGGSPYSHRASPTSSSCPQPRSLNGGSHSTTSASRSAKASARNASAACTSVSAPCNRSRMPAIRAVSESMSCPRARVAAAASNSDPNPHAGSSTVAPFAPVSRTIRSAYAVGVVESRRACASKNRSQSCSNVSAAPSFEASWEISASSSGSPGPSASSARYSPTAASRAPRSRSSPSARSRCHASSIGDSSNGRPRPRSHACTSGSENNGLDAVPPTGLGKSSWRRRQLLTAARRTPARRAMSAALTAASSAMSSTIADDSGFHRFAC